MNNKRALWLDIVKIFACFSVIANHVVEEFMVNRIGIAKPFSFFLCSIQYSISRIAVPLFLMVTGVLLLKKDYTFKDVLKKIIRILVPLIIFTLIIDYRWGVPYSIKSFFEGPIAEAYWYLYVLISLYLMTPIIQKLIKKFEKKDYIYLFVICLIIPGIIDYLKFFNVEISSLLTNDFFTALIVYQIMGVYLKELEKNKKNRNKAWILFTSSSFIYISTLIIFYLKEGRILSVYQDCANIFTGLMAISAFYLFRYYFEDKKIKFDNIIVNISLTTFGIYLSHIVLQSDIINSAFIMNTFNVNPIIAVLLSELLLFFICGIFIYLIRKIPFVDKFL